MTRALGTFVAALAICIAAAASVTIAGQKANGKDWTIPPKAADERNPVTASSSVLDKGQKVFQSKCQRCHGKDGGGRGPDADPEHPAGNLGDKMRATFNPDGVMFYKIWNGRLDPKMPAFKTDGLEKDEVWSVIHFVKTFRK